MRLVRLATAVAVCVLISQARSNPVEGSPVSKTFDVTPRLLMHPGLPTQGIACDSSWAAIGDLLPSAKQLENVSDVTEINTVYSGSRHLGWIYREHDGSRFWQSDFAPRHPVRKGGRLSFGALGEVDAGFGEPMVGLTHDGLHPYRSKSPNLRAFSCFTKGADIS